MKSIILTLIILSISFMNRLQAQDLIIMKNGDEIEAIVSEVMPQSVKYTKFDNKDGPLYTILKSSIFMIKYQNGTKDIMTGSESSPSGGSARSEATFYFYRPKKLASSSAKIIVGTAAPDEVVVKLRNGRWFKMGYQHLGARKFVAGVYVINPEVFTIDVEPGSTYYLRCTVLAKGFKIMAELEMVDQSTAQQEMTSLKEQTQSYVK